MGRKQSNQTNKQNWYCTVYLNFKHSYEQTATEPARYYGTYRIGEQPWLLKDPHNLPNPPQLKICTRVMVQKKG